MSGDKQEEMFTESLRLPGEYKMLSTVTQRHGSYRGAAMRHGEERGIFVIIEYLLLVISREKGKLGSCSFYNPYQGRYSKWNWTILQTFYPF